MEQAAKYEVATRPEISIVNVEDYAMSVDGLVKQVRLIQQVMEKVMKENEHYGKIPGTNKPTLLKPGAEKLCLTFRLDPRYEIIREVRDKDFIAYTLKCSLIHIPSGQQIASGVGSCNTRETKYRYRYVEENTGQPLPKEYWKAREKGDNKEMKRIVGEGNRAAKIDGVWVIAKSQKIENDNPWDLDNTIIKMACKRALVAATLNATAASDIFTQDLEDIVEPVPVQPEAPVSPNVIHPEPAKEKSLFEQLMGARGNFAKLVTDNKDAILDFLPDELKAVKERWEKASAQGVGGVTKGSPWPIQEAKEEAPLFDVEEAPKLIPGSIAFIRNEIAICREELTEKNWGSIIGFYRSWEKEDTPIESLQALLAQCRQTIDKQNAG